MSDIHGAWLAEPVHVKKEARQKVRDRVLREPDAGMLLSMLGLGGRP